MRSHHHHHVTVRSHHVSTASVHGHCAPIHSQCPRGCTAHQEPACWLQHILQRMQHISKSPLHCCTTPTPCSNTLHTTHAFNNFLTGHTQLLLQNTICRQTTCEARSNLTSRAAASQPQHTRRLPAMRSKTRANHSHGWLPKCRGGLSSSNTASHLLQVLTQQAQASLPLTVYSLLMIQNSTNHTLSTAEGAAPPLWNTNA